MRRQGVEPTAKNVQNIYDQKGYPSATDAHELVTRPEQKRDKWGWYVNVVKDGTGKLTHVFWMSVERVAIARCLAHLILHQNTYQHKRYKLIICLFVGVNNYQQLVLMRQSMVVGESATLSTNLANAWGLWAWRLWLCSAMRVLKASAAVAKDFPNGSVFWVLLAHCQECGQESERRSWP